MVILKVKDNDKGRNKNACESLPKCKYEKLIINSVLSMDINANLH